jgi:hypothetical protein
VLSPTNLPKRTDNIYIYHNSFKKKKKNFKKITLGKEHCIFIDRISEKC